MTDDDNSVSIRASHPSIIMHLTSLKASLPAHRQSHQSFCQKSSDNDQALNVIKEKSVMQWNRWIRLSHIKMCLLCWNPIAHFCSFLRKY
jgi:hypothetical protein